MLENKLSQVGGLGGWGGWGGWGAGANENKANSAQFDLKLWLGLSLAIYLHWPSGTHPREVISRKS